MGEVADGGDNPVTELVVVECLVANQKLDGRPVPDVRKRTAS